MSEPAERKWRTRVVAAESAQAKAVCAAAAVAAASAALASDILPTARSPRPLAPAVAAEVIATAPSAEQCAAELRRWAERATVDTLRPDPDRRRLAHHLLPATAATALRMHRTEGNQHQRTRDHRRGAPVGVSGVERRGARRRESQWADVLEESCLPCAVAVLACPLAERRHQPTTPRLDCRGACHAQDCKSERRWDRKGAPQQTRSRSEDPWTPEERLERDDEEKSDRIVGRCESLDGSCDESAEPAVRGIAESPQWRPGALR